MQYSVDAEWVHLSHTQRNAARDVYGFSGSQGLINLEGIRYLPRGRPAKTLLIYMHPASTLQLLPLPRAMAQAGMHVLCAGSRYARNDTSLIFENVLLDLGEYIRHAREVWGYDKVVLCGWSGGGSLCLYYQSQAEKPTVSATPAGDPVDIAGAALIPADAFIFQAAHISRAQLLVDWIDPSVKDENDPDHRILELDLYDPRNPNQPPYSADYLAHFRASQLKRMRRRTAWVKELLEDLRRGDGAERERSFVTHRTMAEPRFLDPSIDPNDRLPGTCFLGPPAQANTSPIALGRLSTLRAWLSQWSIDDSHANGIECARNVTVPFLAIENSADDAVPASHTRQVFAAAASPDKAMRVIQGANHYYVGQKHLLDQVVGTCIDWMQARQLIR